MVKELIKWVVTSKIPIFEFFGQNDLNRVVSVLATRMPEFRVKKQVNDKLSKLFMR